MTNTYQPRNASDAIAQANRFDRAKQLLTDGYTFHKDADSDVVAVVKPGTTAAAYWLNMITEGCDCPDYMKNSRPCKHMIAWDILQAQEAEELAGLEAQCAEYDALHGPEMPPADTTRALMLAEVRRAERGLAACMEPFSTAAEKWRKRVQDTTTALKLYDEVTMKILCDFYKRGLDKPNVRA